MLNNIFANIHIHILRIKTNKSFFEVLIELNPICQTYKPSIFQLLFAYPPEDPN